MSARFLKRIVCFHSDVDFGATTHLLWRQRHHLTTTTTTNTNTSTSTNANTNAAAAAAAAAAASAPSRLSHVWYKPFLSELTYG